VDNNVKLYNGATMGQMVPERYEETYKAFLDKSIQSSPLPTKLITQVDNTILGVKPHHLDHKMAVLTNIALVVGIVFTTSFLLYQTVKRKK
jgi:hypothetical protein